MTDYRALLAELAVPRMVRAGSPNHARVQETLTRELMARGFVVMEHRFPAAPVPLVIISLGGAALAACAVVAAALALDPRHSLWVLLAVVILTAIVAAVAVGMVGAVRDLSRWGQGVNLVGVRPRARVAVWVAAHYDSKGQGTSMAGRLLAVLLAGLGIVGLGLLGANRLFGSHGSVLAWLLAAALAFIGGLGVARGGFNDDSPGAVDNASGLATVLAVLDTLPRDSPVGVIFPDAEEFGLFGAKALVRERANLFEGTAVLNFDGIDDRGSPIAFVHRSGPTVDGIVNRLGARRVRWLPVLVDGLAFAKGARECVTFMRGDWGTARVVHTPRDTVDRLTLAGSREMAVAVAAVLGKRE